MVSYGTLKTIYTKVNIITEFPEDKIKGMKGMIHGTR